MSELIPLIGFTFFVALIYSSVGHGGASGYLALLAFFALPREQMAASALCLNLLVAGLAFWHFFKARHFSWNLIWPFCFSSVPLAFIGGMLKVPASVYSSLLAGALTFAAWRLLFELNLNQHEIKKNPPRLLSLLVGGLIGMLSGIVGVGGGIFLSPLLLLFRWADPKKTAAASAFFILVNSLAGLAGRLVRNQFQLTPLLVYMVLAAFVGGAFGSRLGANYISAKWLRRILAVVLLLAVFKLVHAIA